MYQTIDNVLTASEFDVLQKSLIKPNITKDFFPWSFFLGVAYNQFEHHFISREGEINLDFMHIPKLLAEKLNIKWEDVIRVKANCVLSRGEESLRPAHVDGEYEHKVFLYYLTDSDGDTIFYDENRNIIDRVTPKKNTAITFNGRQLHSSSCPIKHPYRIVINFNVKL